MDELQQRIAAQEQFMVIAAKQIYNQATTIEHAAQVILDLSNKVKALEERMLILESWNTPLA